MLSRLLTARAAKALAVLLLLSCCVGAYISAGACAALFRGEVAVNLTASGAAMLLNGSPQEGGWLSLPEQIYLDAPDGIPAAVRAGVVTMGLLRFLPVLAVLALSALTLVNILRSRLFCGANVRLLFSAGIIMLLAALAVPPVNAFAIPALVNASLPKEVLFVGVDVSRGPHIWQGALYLLGACALQTGMHKAADEQAAPQCL